MRRFLVGLLLAGCVIVPSSVPAIPRSETKSRDALLSRIREARLAGDVAAAQGLLATLEPQTPREVRQPGPGFNVRVTAGEETQIENRWQGNDVLVAGSTDSEIKPSLACDESGTFYTAFELEGYAGDQRQARIYRSLDSGESWSSWATVSADYNISSVSLHAAGGDEPALLMAFVIDDVSVNVVKINPSDPGDFTSTEIIYNAAGVANPRILADSDEYTAWYGYLIWNSRDVTNWLLSFSRSTDMGASWEAPSVLWSYSGVPNEYYDAENGHPDIDYGSNRVRVAFDDLPAPGNDLKRDVFMITSTDYGSSWNPVFPLATTAEDEFDPSLAVVRNLNAGERTVAVAYSRVVEDYDGDYYCLYYAYTYDDASWALDQVLSCYIDFSCVAVDLACSHNRGRVHAVFSFASNYDPNSVHVLYDSVPYDDLGGFSGAWRAINYGGHEDPIYYRPSMALVPNLPETGEAGVVWTDERNDFNSLRDVYFDGANTVGLGTVVVDPSPDNFPAHWLLFAPESPYIEGVGDSTIVDMPEGDYEIYWYQSEDWIPTCAESEVLNLSENQTITFTCSYENIHPQLSALEDVPGDQGRQLRLSWTRSAYDTPLTTEDITGYSVYRRQDRDGARQGSGADRVDGWDWLVWMPAYGDEVYQFVAPTLCDSTESEGVCWSAFFVRASTPDNFVFYDSPPDSGYSVDNLAPAVPENLRLESDEVLVWDPAEDEDFAYFVVYASEDDSFSEDEIIAYVTEPQAEIGAWQGYYLAVSAKDFAGNEGDPGVFDYTGLGSDETLPARYWLGNNLPNPFNPETAIPFALPEETAIRISVVDLSGRVIKLLVDGIMPAGRHQVVWNGSDESGQQVASGMYFCHLESERFVQTRKMTLIK